MVAFEDFALVLVIRLQSHVTLFALECISAQFLMRVWEGGEAVERCGFVLSQNYAHG